MTDTRLQGYRGRAFLMAAAAAWLLAGISRGQGELGSWNVLNARVTLNERWMAFGEGQVRSLRFYDHFHYYEYKGGLQFRLNSQFSLASGLGRYDTYRAGGDFVTPRQNRELRSWLQLGMKNRVSRLHFEHRYRAEQRWTLNGYRNRFRYRLSVSIPLNQEELSTGSVFLNFWNELFLTNRAPFFERNRVFGGIGWEMSDFVSWQAGYLHQYDYRLNDETGKSFFQISLFLQTGISHWDKGRDVNTIN